eukprot:3917609-Amphidinium_carterae.8
MVENRASELMDCVQASEWGLCLMPCITASIVQNSSTTNTTSGSMESSSRRDHERQRSPTDSYPTLPKVAYIRSTIRVKNILYGGVLPGAWCASLECQGVQA